MIPFASDKQPLESVTMYVYGPASLVKVPIPEYGAVPPFAETLTVVLPPLQVMVPFEAEALNAVG